MNKKDKFSLARRVFVSCSLAHLFSGSLHAINVYRPESYGAVGDGMHPDGVAISRMFNEINASITSGKIYVRFTGRYNLEGCGEIEYAPIGWNNMGGIVRGLPPILKDNVTFFADGASFIVPKSQAWRRVKKGGSDKDIFFVAFQLYGNHSNFYGGTLDGNLSNRSITRGPRLSGFGGNEFGFVLGGRNWNLDNVSVLGWGTDCILIGASGKMKGCKVLYGRRNNISIVPFKSNCEIVIESCEISHAGDYSEANRNRPGSGIQVESGRRAHVSSLDLVRSVFVNNREKDVQLSKGSSNCNLLLNLFSSNVNVRPGNLGGHLIHANTFVGEAKIDSLYGLPTNPEILVSRNTFQVSQRDSVNVRMMRRGANLGKLPKVSIINNTYNRT